jgi:Glycogen recognition site of AMP-activated protein kinase
MIKAWDGSGLASVTFTLPAAVGASRVVICGEWNDWTPGVDLMERTPNGFERSLELRGGRRYRFRYLLDGQRWENDWAADA